MSLLVDTLQATRRLENAGFGTAQAEAIVTIVARAGTRVATKDDIERPEGVALATEGDIEHLEASAKTDLRCLEASTKNEIQCLRTELTARMDRKIAEARKDLYALRAEVIKRMGEQEHRLVMMMIVGLGLVLIALGSA